MKNIKPNKRLAPTRRKATRSSQMPDLLTPLLKRNPRSLQDGLRRLTQAIAQGQPRQSTVLSHDDFEALLEFYVDCEREGKDASARYPAVWQHMQTCSRCRLSYATLAEVIWEERAADFIAPDAVTLPALPLSTCRLQDAPWIKKTRRPTGSASLGFAFMIRPKYLQSYSNPDARVTHRGGLEPPAQEKPFLADIFTVGDQDIDVTMWLQQSNKPNHLRIIVEVVTSKPLPEPVNVSFTWNDLKISSRLEKNRAVIDEIPLSVPLSEADIYIEFEQVDNPSAPEEDSGHVG